MGRFDVYDLPLGVVGRGRCSGLVHVDRILRKAGKCSRWRLVRYNPEVGQEDAAAEESALPFHLLPDDIPGELGLSVVSARSLRRIP
jgi:hypothetical protein